MTTALLVINGALLFLLWKSNSHNRKLADHIARVAEKSERLRGAIVQLTEAVDVSKRVIMHLTALGVELREIKQKLEEIEEEM